MDTRDPGSAATPPARIAAGGGENGAARPVEADPAAWRSPSGEPLFRRALCALGQPCLSQPQATSHFVFHDATLLLIAAGRLDIDDGLAPLSVDAPDSLVLVDPGSRADLLKTPGGAERRFRSVFLGLSGALLDDLERAAPSPRAPAPKAPWRCVLLDTDLAATLRHVLDSIAAPAISDERLRLRLLDLLLALAERGQRFARLDAGSTAARLRALIAEAPAHHWTAQTAGRALAMSAATLRRRLATEQAAFEDLLIEVRMHHAMMLVQTTAWGIAHIAEACGYRSRARFTERFQARFGCLPSTVR
ncbi:helix-turn-helix transcriptional regulator [Burkholderia gladioli]|uniref:helix-turn-helix transcriptional regulator n=1 Tax=Burkholderia gladioli TaxID=28095 RepID=UPI001641D02E|nr:helix-turn-helix transcriptional regulator [Burkholderia gladioli]MDN7804143.1 helix-turn-helix transcriptional regulator [Burkholderia gladioli]MDN7918822.1 helix-turn-helix transcriptional regulator [Burkholderia gladioli]